MRPGPFRSAALGFLIGAVALLPLAGCTCHQLEDTTENVLKVLIDVDYGNGTLKFPDPVRIRLNERICWRVGWEGFTLKVDWKNGPDSGPFTIRCEGDECVAESGASKPGTFKYSITVTYEDWSHTIDPDVIVEGAF
jgi:hypothetical protein